jgi:hypothetical protein
VRHRRAAVGAQPVGALGDLRVHVGDVEVRDGPDLGEQPGGGLGIVGVDVDLQRVPVAHDEDRVADRLQRGAPRVRVEVVAGDREVRAVAVGLRGVLGVGDPRRRVVGELGRVGAAQLGDDARRR